MNAEILSQLRSRLASGPRSLDELHRAAAAAGSAWSPEQVELLLTCLPDLTQDGETWRLAAALVADPVTQALLALVTTAPTPAAALVARLPHGVVATATALCDLARGHRDLELLPGNRICRR